ncbi:MAG: hypothetical protein PGN13_04790 [Patulibacter minatonensis]
MSHVAKARRMTGAIAAAVALVGSSAAPGFADPVLPEPLFADVPIVAVDNAAASAGVMPASGATAVRDTDAGISTKIDGTTVRLVVPGADVAAKTDDAVLATTGDGTTTTLQKVESGGKRVAIVIDDAQGSERFPISFDRAGRLSLGDDGRVTVFDGDDQPVSIIEPAWAKDASGLDLPTHFEISGTTLIQVVAHQGLAGVTYPVTADPWWTGCAGTFWGLPFKRVSTYVKKAARRVTFLFLATSAWDCGSDIGTAWGNRANAAIDRCWPNCPWWKPFQFW